MSNKINPGQNIAFDFITGSGTTCGLVETVSFQNELAKQMQMLGDSLGYLSHALNTLTSVTICKSVLVRSRRGIYFRHSGKFRPLSIRRMEYKWEYNVIGY